MRRIAIAGLGLLVAAGLALPASPASAAPNCIVKAGEGSGGSDDAAKFQAWEAVLQATDWGMWATWMATSMKVGVAPGYKVTIQRTRCKPGSCFIQAKLCK